MRRKFLPIVSLLLCPALLLGACAGKEKEDNVFTGNKTTTPSYQVNLDVISPSAYRDAGGLNLEPGTYISVIGKEGGSAYWRQVRAGVLQAAEDLNNALGYKGEDKVKVVFNAPSGGEDVDEQVNILDEELARYPDVIAISSIDSEASSVQFDLATENGIPIVAFDSGNSYQGIQCTCRTNNKEAVRTGVKRLCDAIDNQGAVALFVHDSVSENAKERAEAAIKEIEENHPEVKIAQVFYMDGLEELKKEAAKEMEEAGGTPVEMSDEELAVYYLSQHSDLRGFFGTDAVTSQFAVRTARLLEKEGKVQEGQIKIVGFDAGKTQLDSLENGELTGIIVQNPFGMGYAAVISAARAALGLGNEAEVDTGYVWATWEIRESPSVAPWLYDD